MTSTIDLPTTTSIPAVDHFRPPSLKGLTAVIASACSGDQVAIARADNDNVDILNVTDGKFVQHALPSAAEAVALAYGQSGTLAIGLSDYQSGHSHQILLVSSQGQTRSVDVRDSSHLAVEGSDFTSGAGGQHVAGAATAQAATAGPELPGYAGTGANPNLGAAQPLPGGRLIVPLPQGLAILDPAGRVPGQTIRLGPAVTRTGIPPLAGGGVAQPTPETVTAYPPVSQVVTDTSGAAFVASGQSVFKVVVT